MSTRCTQLGVTDVQIGLASLEEVFLAIARRAEMEAAAAEGRTTLAWQLEDGSTLEVGEVGWGGVGWRWQWGWRLDDMWQGSACAVQGARMRTHGACPSTPPPAPAPQVGMGEEYAEKDGVQYRIR